jgi:hypothetical protein
VRVIASIPRSGFKIPRCYMDKYQRIDENIRSALKGEEISLVIPALTICLARAGAFSGVTQEEFVDYVLSTIKSTFDEYKERIQ